VRIFNEEGITLDDLRESSAQELKVCPPPPPSPSPPPPPCHLVQEMGIPSGARKKIIAALHPDLMLN
jgi:hypothetical protein